MLIRMRGRTGHQMLIYATARTTTDDLTINISDAHHYYALDKFNIIGQVLPIEADVRGISSWKAEGFDMIRDKLIKEFSLKEQLDKDHELMKKIRESNSVAIHVRRGDYVGTHKKQRGGICTLDYYLDAIFKMVELVEDPTFFIFSDDIEWCKKKFRSLYPIFIEGNPPHIDLELMKNCKHFIIANSSFSWWGAWLSENKDKVVIMPKKWDNISDKSNQLILDEWIKV